jgi:uncharacterized protein (PEP-CTERM system associated)
MRTGKTGLLFTVFSEKRRFLTSLREEDTWGFSSSIDRRVAPRTNAVLSGSWQRIEDDDPRDNVENEERDFWFIDAQLRRQISPRLDGMVGYTFTRQESGRDDDGYDENRVIARITAYF